MRGLLTLLALVPATLAGGQIGRRGLINHADIKARQAAAMKASRDLQLEETKRWSNDSGSSPGYRFRNDQTERE